MHSALLILADHGQPGRRLWRLQPQRLVRTVSVVMLDVDAEDLLQVATADDQQPVQALGTGGAHPALRIGIRLGCPDRGYQHLATLRAEHVVEAATELRVVVAEHEAHRLDPARLAPTADYGPAWVTQRPFG
jgi:hypothetical protein